MAASEVLEVIRAGRNNSLSTGEGCLKYEQVVRLYKILKKTRCVMKLKCPRTRQIPEVAIIVKTPRSRFQNLRLQYKGLVTSNIHMKYKSPITYHSKDMAKVKVFKKWVKLQGQSHRVKNFGTNRKVLS
jgi:hypothetical protein